MKQMWMAQRTLRTELVLRACTERDLDALEWFGMFAHDRGLIRDAWSRHRAGLNDMVVVEFGGFPVAQTWIDLEQRARDNTALLWAVRVFPIFQGHGIGSWMLSEVEAWLGQRGFSAAELGVEPWNKRAFSLYERLGYREYGELVERTTCELPNGEPVDQTRKQRMMRKALSPIFPQRRAFPHGRTDLPQPGAPD